MSVVGDTILITFRAANFEGKPADLQVRVTRRGPDDYNWLLEEKQVDHWKQLATLEYLRTR